MKIQLVITLEQETGQVEVSGPITNRTLCYGLLEMARESIYEFSKQQPAPGIVPIRMALPKNGG